MTGRKTSIISSAGLAELSSDIQNASSSAMTASRSSVAGCRYLVSGGFTPAWHRMRSCG
jgi:hypothetical protein